MFFYPWNEWKEKFRNILIHKELLKYNIISYTLYITFIACLSFLIIKIILVIETEESIVLRKEEEQREKLRYIYKTFRLVS